MANVPPPPVPDHVAELDGLRQAAAVECFGMARRHLAEVRDPSDELVAYVDALLRFLLRWRARAGGERRSVA